MQQYFVWLDSDCNDNFYVQAETPEEAAFKALTELGWNIGTGEPIEDKPDVE